MSPSDDATYWDIVETLLWIFTRDEGRVGTRWDMKEENRAPLAMSAVDEALNPSSRLLLAKYGFEADCELAVQRAGRSWRDSNESGIIGPREVLNYLLRQVQNRRIRVSAIQCDRYRVRQVPLPISELNDLEFRISPGHRIARVGLWSRSRNSLIWRSPQFFRADVIRVWPAQKKQTADVPDAILRHLREIMSSTTPLTRAEAQRRCLAEVPDAYAAAFNKAWSILDPHYKRGRGKHGSRRTEP
jgi:hypothetical protein